MGEFYTYVYVRQDGTPYYVGKGVRRRAFIGYGRRAHRPKDDARIFMQHWPDEATAFEMEKYYIRLFGRKDNGTGILRNLTDGGEGILGIKRPPLSEEWKDGIRKSMMGHEVTDITRTKMKAVPHSKAKGELGAHSRWHVQRNIVKLGCALCLQ